MPNHSNILVVAEEHASGLPRLLNASVEADIIKRVAPQNMVVSLDQRGSLVHDVLATLPGASIVHFACHGQQSKENPLNSGFTLADGRLTLEELIRLNMPHAQLAYLSACESAAMDENQPDEAVNLAATMLFVGFKSVIATMWSVIILSIVLTDTNPGVS
jgi:CHAT domain-containing protein